MTTHYLFTSDLRIGGYYNVVKLRYGVRISDIIATGSVKNANILSLKPLGKLIEIRQIGRPYDPDIKLLFEKDGRHLEIIPELSSGFSEYEPDTEEMSIQRTLERTRILRDEIRGNDWALRPENVLFTQDIDLNGWAEGKP